MVQHAVSLSNIFLTILLGTIFTALPHTMFIGGMKYVKTQTAGIITCLEPLYGIILAGILIHEIPAVSYTHLDVYKRQLFICFS